MQEAWEGFKEGIWTGEVDVRDFIQKNYTPYEGDESFLAGPTERTKELWGEVLDLLLKEREQGGVLDMDTKTVTGIVSHPAGYIDNAHREKETIVGLQTDKPLKRALHVNGGIRIACQAASQHGYKVDENVVERYTFERKTHNAGKVVAGSQLDHVAAVQAVPAVQIRIPCRAAVGDEIGAQGSSVLRQGTAHDLLHAPVM